MALMQITIIPLGEGISVGHHVAEVQRFLAREKIPYRLHDMGTVIEGDAEELFALAARIHALPFESGVGRVVTQVTVDDRRDKKVAIGDKTKAVKKRLEQDR